ncbi:hemolysin family protein [Candidatus Allofournierella merdipullorum]
MKDSLVLMLLLQAALIGLNAVFACAEIAVISMNDTRLARLAASGDKRAVRLARLTSQPARFLATIQVAITLSGFLGSAFAAENFSDGLVDWLLSLGVPVPAATLDAAAVVIITLVLSYFTLVFGELVPKRLAMRKAEPLALGMSALLCAIARLCAPLVWLLTASTNAVLRLLGVDPNAHEETVSEEEIRMMVDAGSEKGVIDRSEKEFIQNVFEFDDRTAGEIATHRTEVQLLRMEEGEEAWDRAIRSGRHSLYPVCEGSADNVVGVLNARDYLCLEDKSRAAVMTGAVRPAYFVPECVGADVLFRNMKRTRNAMAVVLDEYGGLEGIVTMNDLLEQLVGELDGDEETPPVQAAGPGVWQVRGDAELTEVAAALDMPLPGDEYETFNGLVLGALGSIPPDGTTIEVKTAGLTIHVTELRSHQVKTALVRRAPEPETDS